ncbi:uncharacterized protein LOC111406808 [Olea europaea var. sylvestris]|uniref:uncharacterized protein LOC111406808 n=1 Tax=Olea europaea var. sylvestris TaxID=158386 RepID=UPI000C1CFDF6|nr:uncharacterized protein LOC111406808 [Olea europaea var. sylvestris]
MVSNKIDRATINDVWTQSGIHSIAEFLPSGCLSDNSPCIVSLLQQDDSKGKPFRFFNMWTHDNFLDIVQDGWNKEIAETASIILKEAKVELQGKPTNVHLQCEVATLRKDAMNLGEAERSFYYQKAMCAYLKNSDKCTKFFHLVVKRNNKKNYIATILKRDGTYTSHKEVVDEFTYFYSDLLGKSCFVHPIEVDIVKNGPLLMEEHASSLIREISYKEIKEALFSIGDEKSSRPDGYTSCFFKKAWNIVGCEFKKAIKDFFKSSSLLKQTNHTVIAMVPKTNYSFSVGGYRPIACSEAAFVEERSMTENIQLAQELLRQYNWKRVAPRYLIKIDLRKAYDSVN